MRILALIPLLLLAACADAPPEATWYKGNLHTHSLWSDGDDYPEAIAAWYQARGYYFLAISDHNTLNAGERWIDPARRGGMDAFDAYRAAFGDDWVETRTEGDTLTQVRLKTLAEYRTLFEEDGRFLLFNSEEITDHYLRRPVHVNAHNLAEKIEPQGGGSIREVMQNNVDAVRAQRVAMGQPMFPHINHPNFGWAITAEDLIALDGERFFEVYNGHPFVRLEGDTLHVSMERMWDIVLTGRLAAGKDVMYGLATDDAHHYHTYDSSRSNPGRGWVMVRAEALTPEALIDALEAGDFYASTGVTLASLRMDDRAVALQIDAQPGVTYRTRFVGTRAGYDTTSTPVFDAQGWPLTRRYSADVGATLATVDGPAPRYQLQGDELYVRAVVVSSQPMQNAVAPGEVEQAWTQPYVPERND